MAAIAFLRLTSAWAIVTGALLIASTRRLPFWRGRWMLTLAGVVSTTWGALASAWGPTATTAPEATAWWLLGYALPFAAALLALAGLLQQDSSAPRRN
jgi:peptidoglycan/LPS O-acetylase OafA/YrhL